jgi:hypothetical protein
MMLLKIRPLQYALLLTAAFSLVVPILAQSQWQRPKRYLWPEIGNNHVTTNKVLVKIDVGTETPARIAYWIPGENRQYDNQLNADEIQKLDWKPFQPEVMVDLGSGAGKRKIWFVAELENPQEYKQEERIVTVDDILPTIVITYPTNRITSQPLLQLQGYCSGEMMDCKYDIANSSGSKINQDAQSSGGEDWDEKKFDWTKFCFQCYDIDLAPGTNFITFHCKAAGNQISTNIEMVFTTVGDTNPPIFKPDWPQDGMSISGSQFDLHGPCDDPTAIVTAFICNDEGKSSRLEGFVERNGYLWVERVPLAEGKNYITVVTTDTAQNSSVTNLMVAKSDFTLYMDPVPDPNQLWQPRITVTGFDSRTNDTIFVNDVKAKLNPNGHWVATNVPVNSPNGGTATFHMHTHSDDSDSPITNSWLPTICGESTNFLSSGVSFPSVSTNEYDHYPVYLGMTNTSGKNIPMTWMLPVEAARFSLHLYDTNNKEVAKREYSEKSGQALPNNLNIHRLGKNELSNIDGVISFSINSTARIASLNLDEHFQLPPPGEYRLKIVARLFKVADDGRLMPFEFPPISTMLQIINQPSEMIFYLNDLQRQRKLTWGAELNFLRIGVAHGLNERSPSEANPIEIYLQNSSTNDFHNWNLRLPNPNEQFDISLYDSSGNEVPKTALGKQHGQSLSLDGQNPAKTPSVMDDINPILVNGNIRRNRMMEPVFVSVKDATECGRFNLNDYFEIKSPGNYKLTYQQRFYRWNTNSTLTGITMPTVTVPLETH